MDHITPAIIEGGAHTDSRGMLSFNNNFDATAIKRVYLIENATTDIVRAWQGHRIEQRWFSAVKGVFRINLIKVDDWTHPSRTLKPLTFLLDASKMDVLHIPGGYISSIRSEEAGSKLLVMADYALGSINDEYRYDINYFEP